MDSRLMSEPTQQRGPEHGWIPVFLAAGWLLVTLGLWGGVGRPWWIWPLSVGLGLLAVGAAYSWGFWQLLKTKAAEPEEAVGPRRASA